MEIRRWVKHYPHYRYMFCSWQYCWLGMTKYTWSTPLLPLWCRCDLDSPFLSWVFCHKHGHSQFNLHQRRAEGSDPFLWAEGVPDVEVHRMMSVQYGTVSCHNGLSVNGERGSEMVAQKLSMGKEPDTNPHPLLVQIMPTLLKNLRNQTEVLKHPMYSLDLTPSDSPVRSI
jgi:hypothetical protein